MLKYLTQLAFLTLSLFLISCTEDDENDTILGDVDEEQVTPTNGSLNTSGDVDVKRVTFTNRPSNISSDTAEKKIKERICIKHGPDRSVPSTLYIDHSFKATIELYSPGEVRLGKPSLRHLCTIRYLLVAYPPENVHSIRTIKEETKHASKMEICEKYLSDKATEHERKGYSC